MILTNLLLVGCILLTVGTLNVLAAWRGGGPFTRFRRLVAGALLVGVGGLCVGLFVALRSFEAFAAETVVAEVRCRWTGSKQFELTWTPATSSPTERPQPKTFQLQGDQWSVSGGIVKWHPWLTALGFSSYHKPTRISGRYARTDEETASTPTAFPLNGDFDPVWWWFHRYDRFLPFVDATYGSAAYLYVNPALVVEVRVSPSGYLIKSKRPERRPRASPRP